MKIDPTTWCSENNRAAKYLADTIESIGDDKLFGKVSVYFHKFNNRLHALNGLEKGMRHYYMGLLLERTQQEIAQNIRYDKVKSLMHNVIVSIYRQELKKLNLK